MDLVTAGKKDSQGLCFIGKVRLPEFLQQKLEPRDGVIYQIDETAGIYSDAEREFATIEEELAFSSHNISYKPEMGKAVGKHAGAHFYTIGQRKGLNVGGTKEPLFIIATDVESNAIYTGMGQSHPGLFRKALYIRKEEVHWIRQDLRIADNETMDVMVRIRYRQPLQKATLHQFETGMYISFQDAQSAITEGQFAAWYMGNELIGSGVIS